MPELNQTYALARDIETNMRERKFPIRVQYGPEPFKREFVESGLIVLSRDRSQPDTFTTPVGANGNPKKQRTRQIPCIAAIHAASTLPGALLEDHEREADIFVDGFVAELDTWCQAGRALLEIGGGRFLTLEEQGITGETYHGVVYRLTFTVHHSVSVLTYEGEAKPTADVAATRVSEIHLKQHGSDAPPEVIPL